MLEGINKKTIIVAVSSIVVLIVLLLVGAYIFSIVSPTYLEYGEVEEKIAVAGKAYYQKNPTLLPTEDGETTLQYSTLVEGGYIKELTKMVKNGEACNAHVIVAKNGNYYSYIPFLSCPDYESKSLVTVILDNNKVVTEEKGLYKINDAYVFRGEVETNYVKFNETLWRIMRVESDNTIKLIQDEITHEEKYPWDDRFNINKNASYGYNDFEVSRIKETLGAFSSSEILVKDALKAKLVPKQLCVGGRGLDDTTKNGETECAKLSEDKFYFGLLSMYEYMQVSLDNNCVKIKDGSCSNYNYLKNEDYSFWTLTPDTENTYYVYYYSAGVEISKAYSYKRVLLTTYLSDKAYYKSGSGTKEDPYIFR